MPASVKENSRSLIYTARASREIRIDATWIPDRWITEMRRFRVMMVIKNTSAAIINAVANTSKTKITER
jgi:hypothetical protein